MSALALRHHARAEKSSNAELKFLLTMRCGSVVNCDPTGSHIMYAERMNIRDIYLYIRYT